MTKTFFDRNVTGQNVWIVVGIGAVPVLVLTLIICLIWVLIKKKKEQKSIGEGKGNKRKNSEKYTRNILEKKIMHYLLFNVRYKCFTNIRLLLFNSCSNYSRMHSMPNRG